jgi:hypothetical protein
MKRWNWLGVAVLALMLCASEMVAPAKGAGAVRGGVRGAMVGGMVGGGSGAKTGATVGAVTGATRGAVQRADYRSDQQNAMNQESQARQQYASTAEYQNATHSNFNQAPPEVIVTSATVESPAQPEETVISQNGKPILAVTFPADWKLKKGQQSLTATSADGQAWSAFSTLPDVSDKQAGIEKIKGGLAKYLQDIQFDDLQKTERGAWILTGTGKGKKSGAEVVFATGVFNATPQQLAGAAFLVDQNLEDHYKETVRSICQTIRTQNDLAQQ